MKYLNRLGEECNLRITEGSKVEIIIRSSLYCNENEKPVYHSGKVTEIIFEGSKEFPSGMYVSFDRDSLYDDGEEELIYFSQVENVFVKKYDILGYGKLNDGVALSIKGEGVGKIVWFTYRKGSLFPEFISDGSGLEKRSISVGDHEFIKEIGKYGESQTFFNYVLSNSK